MGTNQKAQNTAKNPKVVICDLIIGVLAVVIVIMVLAISSEVVVSWDGGYSENSLYYNMRDGRYANMVEMVRYNEACGVKETDALAEYYGVAHYYEAASLYKAYLELGDTEQADAYKAAMEEAQEEMGAYAPEVSAIKEQLGF